MFQIQIEARDERDLLRGTTSFSALCATPAQARRTLCELASDDPAARAAAERFGGLEELELSGARYRRIRACVLA